MFIPVKKEHPVNQAQNSDSKTMGKVNWTSETDCSSKMGTFLENTLWTPPRNVTKLFTGLLQPTFQQGTSSFVSGGPYGPEGEPSPIPFMGRVPICFMSEVYSRKMLADIFLATLHI